MATVVLRPHDCLTPKFPHETLIPPSRKHGRNPNRTRSGRRKRSPSDNDSDRDRSGRSRSSSSSTMVVKFPAKNLVMGEVKILKRGEDIKKIDNKTNSEMKFKKSESDVFSTERLGPEPEMIPKEIRLTDLQLKADDVVENFAGSGFVVSPSPRSLPVPSFFTKKAVDSPSSRFSSEEMVHDTATKDLLRLLRLDLF